jgi:hypothetical protein
MGKQISLLQKIAWMFSAGFIFVVLLGYMPGVKDEQGLMFGLFKIDPIDDILHLASGAWAAFAAWRAARYAIFYFKWFGSAYLLDGIIGSITGKGLLDFTVFMQGTGIIDLGTRIAANIPHILIGGSAVFIGFVLGRKFQSQNRLKQ